MYVVRMHLPCIAVGMQLSDATHICRQSIVDGLKRLVVNVKWHFLSMYVRTYVHTYVLPGVIMEAC